MEIIPDPIARECRSDFPAYHHSGERRVSSIRYAVVHDAEANSAESVARYFHSPSSGGSAQTVVDDFRCYRCLGDNVIPWAAPPLNTHGYHVEFCGFAAWGRGRWMLHRNTIRRGAYKIALRCKWYRIPPRWLDVNDLRRDFGTEIEGGVPQHQGPMRGGLVTHATISEAYELSDHHDPGPNFPLDVLLADVLRYLGQDGRNLLAQHPKA